MGCGLSSPVSTEFQIHVDCTDCTRQLSFTMRSVDTVHALQQNVAQALNLRLSIAKRLELRFNGMLISGMGTVDSTFVALRVSPDISGELRVVTMTGLDRIQV